ncbi:DMT family transporter [Pseudoalteromonas aurantia]|uniref:Bacterial/archaeal transporter family-2 protein n=1 Tax=Pseudoalteromonas aurantia 208 TaxID=1314867 RepID=A0ABR9EJI1_9GAMM|nr:DMT family transporter [Pseudoalteromonas aurantia]MBE0371116.1 bacterial/archaeal transporter family-2 protein [Pseudoalteromonas aurantia 208]
MMYVLLACIAGAAIAFQASINAQLGVLLKSPILATTTAFFVSGCYAMVVYLSTERPVIDLQTATKVPWYLWTVGGLFSVIGVGLSYYLIPKMGIGNLMSLVLTGQLLMAMMINHFGWFHTEPLPITTTKVLGILALLVGIYLVNKGKGYA